MKGKDSLPVIADRKFLQDYCQRSIPRVRLFSGNGAGQMRGDGFIYERDDLFYVNPDWTSERHILKPGDRVGFEFEGRDGFYPLVIDIIKDSVS